MRDLLRRLAQWWAWRKIERQLRELRDVIDAQIERETPPDYADRMWAAIQRRLTMQTITETLATLTHDEIRSACTAALAQIAQRDGEPLTLWTGRDGQIHPKPATGAILGVYWAVSDQSYETWYPSVGAAQAELHALALHHGRVPREDGLYVDLTAPGCHTSYARIERLNAPLRARGILLSDVSIDVVADACTAIASVFSSLQLGCNGGREGEVTAKQLERLLGASTAVDAWELTDPAGRSVSGDFGADLLHGAPQEIRVGTYMGWRYHGTYQRRYLEVHSASSGTVIRIRECWASGCYDLELDFGGPSSERWAACREALAQLAGEAQSWRAPANMRYRDERGDLCDWPRDDDSINDRCERTAALEEHV